MEIQFTSHTSNGIDKTSRYGWVTKDAPGVLAQIHKDELRVCEDYQRSPEHLKIKAITSNWSWLSAGVLTVAKRDGIFWVVDGQHRLLAARRRSDITNLPCNVFETVDVKTEARAFLDTNVSRRAVSAIDKQKAMVIAEDEIAIFVQEQFDALGLVAKSHAKKAGQLKCVAWCKRRANEDKETFRKVLAFGAQLCESDEVPIHERLLEGLWYLNAKCGVGLEDKRLTARLREKGSERLVIAANRAHALTGYGGGKVWGKGMLDEINKGLRQKFNIGDGAIE